MSKAKTNANAAQAVLDANRAALVGFDSAVVHGLFTDMGKAVDDGEGCKAEKSAAALELCRHAEVVAIESRKAGATEIDKGWSANVRMMLPMLAKEGSPFVKVKVEAGKDTRFTLSGYGQNVNSIARGYCQYSDIGVTAEKAETYVECREAVQARRAEDLTPAEKELIAAKETLTDLLASIRSQAVAGADIDLINDTIELLTPIDDDLTAMHLIEEDAETETVADDSATDDSEAASATG